MSSGLIYDRADSVVRECYKVCIGGKYGSGKTSIFHCCMGITNDSGVCKFTYDIANPCTRIILYDTGGRERKESITMSDYYKNCACVVFVYDITNKESLHYIKREFELIKEKEICETDAKFVILRNKIDVGMNHVDVTQEYETQFLRDNAGLFRGSIRHVAETSALENRGIENFFQRDLIEILLNPT